MKNIKFVFCIAMALFAFGARGFASEDCISLPSFTQEDDKQVFDTVVNKSDYREIVNRLKEEGWTEIDIEKDGEMRRIHAVKYLVTKVYPDPVLLSDTTDDEGIRTTIYSLYDGRFGIQKFDKDGNSILIEIVDTLPE